MPLQSVRQADGPLKREIVLLLNVQIEAHVLLLEIERLELADPPHDSKAPTPG